MKKYHASLTIDYDFEAEDEEDAIYELADLIRQDWMFYTDEFDLEEVGEAKDEPSQTQS